MHSSFFTRAVLAVRLDARTPILRCRQPHPRWRTVAWASAAAVAAACGSDGVTRPSSRVASITLAAQSAEVLTSRGDARTVSAVARDVNGAVVTAPPFVWASDAPDVVTVVGAGAAAVLTAVGDGTAQVTATAGGVRGRLTVSVHRTVASLTLAAPSHTLTLGGSIPLVAIARDARQYPIDDATNITYVSSNPRSVVVSSVGVATARFDFDGSASSVVTATLTRDGISVSDTLRLVVVPPVRYNYLALLLGDFVRPAPTLTPGRGVAYLTSAPDRIDYVVSWSDLADPVTAVHLHGPATSNGVASVLVDVHFPVEGARQGTVTGTIRSSDIRGVDGLPPISLAALSALLAEGVVYLDVHTLVHPNGEVGGDVILRRLPEGS